MSALSKQRIDGIVAAYRDDESATLASVAEAEELNIATVRKHIESAGVPIRPDFSPSDDDLGIGASVEDVTNSAAFKDAVAEAVAQALAKVGVKSASPSPDGPNSPDWQDFIKKMEALTDSVNVQKPGYQKPLTPAELSLREEGRREFFNLLRDTKNAVHEYGKQGAISRGLVPQYIVGEKGFYGNTASGETLFEPGLRIYLTVAPPEDFLPMNEAAAAIMRAQLQWLGEPTPEIGELVAQAMMRANGSDSTFIVGNEDPVHADDASLVDANAEVLDMRPKRTMGMSVPELRGMQNGPLSPGAMQAPAGPIFVN